MRKLVWTFGVLLVASIMVGCGKEESCTGYLFTYFTGNGPKQEQIHFALSNDGHNFKALNNNKPIIDSKDISVSGGVRDPHILRCEDGKTFYMVVTDLYVTDMGWENTAMVLMKSTDLIHWESSVIDIPKTYPKEFSRVNRVWAPQTIFDENTGKYMVYFSMRIDHDIDIIYYAYTNDSFTALESAPKQLFFSPTNNACIDADIIKKDHQYYMFFKSEDGIPGIKLAVSDKINDGYKQLSQERVDCERNNVEGSGVFKLNNSDEWILMYDVYTSGRYQFTKSKDLKHFEVIDEDVNMDFHPRHGTVLPITKSEMERLVKEWGSLDNPMIEVASSQAKQLNVDIDTKKHSIHIPVKPGTDLSAFDPEFKSFPGYTISPCGAQNFLKGSIDYTFSIEDRKSVVFKVSASEDHNPIVEGYYADPDILYAEKTKKFYLYPTSDGFSGWSGYYFKTFSSDNLVDWKDEGVILDLKKKGEVTWADRNAWAPCIVEKEIEGVYKYFYYYTAAQKVGVAVAEDPTGPFVDKGEPLVNFKLKGVNRGQEIDPDVFTDPVSGKSYLYWGNGYMAGVELNDDMVSFDKSKIVQLHPDGTYREGTYVFYRKGKYYFLWSEDDTRSPNYRVRWATANSPLGKLHIPKDNIVLQKKTEDGIYGTGHNSILQLPNSDKWYICYHRFTLPKGITMGRAAGYHREVCLDELTFDEEGNILEVTPTKQGIDAVNINK